MPPAEGCVSSSGDKKAITHSVKEGTKDRGIASQGAFGHLQGVRAGVGKGLGRLLPDGVDGGERKKSSRGQGNLEKSMHM